MSMTSHERYVAVSELREPDRVPVSPFIMTFAARFAGVTYEAYGRYGEVMAEAQIKTVRHFGFDSAYVGSDAVREAETVGAPVYWQEDEVPGAVSDDPLLKVPEDVHSLRLPDPLGPNRMYEQIKCLRILLDELGPEGVVYAWVEAPFQESAMLRGIANLMTDLYEHKQTVHELMRFSTEMELEFGLAQIEAGATFIGVGDAIASLISPRHYEEFNFPYVAELIGKLKKAGAIVKYHACGRTKALLPLFRDLGADILNLDSLIDIGEAKALLGDKVCLKGNIDPSAVMLQGTAEEVRAAARRCIEAAGYNGGFILSPGCELPRDTPHANVWALMEAAREFGTYPIKTVANDTNRNE
jgi:uroporphyrinogen decarboxylase